MIRGLSITKQMKNDVSSGGRSASSRSPDVRIRSKKGDAMSKGGQSLGSMGSPKGNFRDFRSKVGSKMEDRKLETATNDFPGSPGQVLLGINATDILTAGNMHAPASPKKMSRAHKLRRYEAPSAQSI
jgi:hypothetical protein